MAAVYIDLLDSHGGKITFSYLTDYLIADIDGWYSCGARMYSAEVKLTPPVVDVAVSTNTAVVVLYDWNFF